MGVLTETHWAGTIQLNAVRVMAASIVIVVLFVLGRLFGVLNDPSWARVSVFSVFMTPAAALIGGLFVILACRAAAAMGVPFVESVSGLVSLVMIAFIMVGDPLVWLVRRYYPQIVPVETFHPFNFHAVMLVQRS